MKMRALVLGAVDVREIVAKQGKRAGETFTFRTLNVIDMDAPGNLQDRMELDVHENSLTEAQGLAGKTVVLNVYQGKDKQGGVKMYFGGQQVQVAPAKTAVNQ